MFVDTRTIMDTINYTMDTVLFCNGYICNGIHNKHTVNTGNTVNACCPRHTRSTCLPGRPQVTHSLTLHVYSSEDTPVRIYHINESRMSTGHPMLYCVSDSQLFCKERSQGCKEQYDHMLHQPCVCKGITKRIPEEE